jgi:DNA-binding transcriptional regulator GbsR (MarR family)
MKQASAVPERNVMHMELVTQMDVHSERYVSQWGNIMESWGLTSNAGRVFGLMTLEQSPLSIDDLAGSLQMSRSTTTIAVQELEQSGYIHSHKSTGERKQMFECPTHPWEVFQNVLRTRQRRSEKAAIELQRCLDLGIEPEGPVRTYLDMFSALNNWYTAIIGLPYQHLNYLLCDRLEECVDLVKRMASEPKPKKKAPARPPQKSRGRS